MTDGYTKIDAPMMIPTTSAVACSGVMERESMRGQSWVAGLRVASGGRVCPRRETQKCLNTRTNRAVARVPQITPGSLRFLTAASQPMVDWAFAKLSAECRGRVGDSARRLLFYGAEDRQRWTQT